MRLQADARRALIRADRAARGGGGGARARGGGGAAARRGAPREAGEADAGVGARRGQADGARRGRWRRSRASGASCRRSWRRPHIDATRAQEQCARLDGEARTGTALARAAAGAPQLRLSQRAGLDADAELARRQQDRSRLAARAPQASDGRGDPPARRRAAAPPGAARAFHLLAEAARNHLEREGGLRERSELRAEGSASAKTSEKGHSSRESPGGWRCRRSLKM